MIEGCPAFDSGSGYAPAMLATIDCDASQLARLGFNVFSGPGSPILLMIGAMMTLLIALLGYRLVLGGKPDLSEAVMTMIKIGLVLAFATQWPAYRTMFYNVAIQGPGELLAKLPFAEIDDPGRFPDRLQADYDALAALEMPKPSILSAGAPAPRADPLAGAQMPTHAEVSYGNFLSFRPVSAGLFMLSSALFALALPRLVAGFMLALGPLFIAFLLFDATRSIFLGWIRTLSWSIIANVLATVLLGIELSIIEPQISMLTNYLKAGEPSLAITGELIATSLLFALLLLGGLIAAIAPTRLNIISLPVRAARASRAANQDHIGPSAQGLRDLARAVPDVQRSRAQQIGDHMALAAAGEARSRETGETSASARRVGLTSGRSASDHAPLGQSYRPVVNRRPMTLAKRNGK